MFVYLFTQEDEQLESLVQQVGFKWAQISRELPGHPRKQCRDRYLTQINREMRKNPWTRDEEKQLLLLMQKSEYCVLYVSSVSALVYIDVVHGVLFAPHSMCNVKLDM